MTNEEVAIKKIIVSDNISADKVNDVFKEAKSLQKINHPNIIKLRNVFMVQRELFMMIEYFPGGDLNKYLKKVEYKLNEYDIKTIL